MAYAPGCVPVGTVHFFVNAPVRSAVKKEKVFTSDPDPNASCPDFLGAKPEPVIFTDAPAAALVGVTVSRGVVVVASCEERALIPALRPASRSTPCAGTRKSIAVITTIAAMTRRPVITASPPENRFESPAAGKARQRSYGTRRTDYGHTVCARSSPPGDSRR